MSKVRLRRLTADHAKLKEYARQHPRVRLIQAEGDPPERYQLEFRINSIRMVDDQPQSVKSHMVEIVLPRNYPRTPPQCRMLSPVFHPNIAPHAICVGDHWSSGEPLASIVMRIGELLAYQIYNVKSPLNGDAARWVELNQEKLPLDSVSLLVEEQSSTVAASVPAAEGVPINPPLPPNSAPVAIRSHSPEVAAQPTSAASVICPSCQKKYRFRKEMAGRKLRCIGCDTVFIPSGSNESTG